MFSRDVKGAFKAIRDSLRVKEEVIEEFAALLDGALGNYRGQKQAFALSLRERISAAIGEELRALIRGRLNAPLGGPTPPTLEAGIRSPSCSRSYSHTRGPAPLIYKALVITYAIVTAVAAVVAPV